HVSVWPYRLPHAPGWEAGAPRPWRPARPERRAYRRSPGVAAHGRQARVDQQSGFILATNELDEGQWSAQAVLDGYKGQAQVEGGVRFLTAPQFLASSLSLKNPERILALCMVVTGRLLSYAALAYPFPPSFQAHK